MLFWLYDLPLPLMAVLICVPCLAFTWGGLLVLRPRVRRWLGPQPGANELVSTFSPERDTLQGGRIHRFHQ